MVCLWGEAPNGKEGREISGEGWRFPAEGSERVAFGQRLENEEGSRKGGRGKRVQAEGTARRRPGRGDVYAYLGNKEASGSEAEGERGDFKKEEVMRLEGDKPWPCTSLG